MASGADLGRVEPRDRVSARDVVGDVRRLTREINHAVRPPVAKCLQPLDKVGHGGRPRCFKGLVKITSVKHNMHISTPVHGVVCDARREITSGGGRD